MMEGSAGGFGISKTLDGDCGWAQSLPLQGSAEALELMSWGTSVASAACFELQLAAVQECLSIVPT